MSSASAVAFVALVCVLTASPVVVHAAVCSPLYGQCGGVGYMGPKCCAAGLKCFPQVNKSGVLNIYYSQCLPANSPPGYPQCPALKQGLCCPGAKELSICNFSSTGLPYYCQSGRCVECGVFSQASGVCCPQGPPQAPCALPGGSGALFPGFCQAPPPTSPAGTLPKCVICGEEGDPCCPGAKANSKCGTRSVSFCKGTGSGTALTCTACGGANSFPAKQPCCPSGLYAGYNAGGCTAGKVCKAGFCV